jgi:hypothetical protein
MVIPHSQSRQTVRHLDYPSQTEVVGRVTGVAMQIELAQRQPATRNVLVCSDGKSAALAAGQDQQFV